MKRLVAISIYLSILALSVYAVLAGTAQIRNPLNQVVGVCTFNCGSDSSCTTASALSCNAIGWFTARSDCPGGYGCNTYNCGIYYCRCIDGNYESCGGNTDGGVCIGDLRQVRDYYCSTGACRYTAVTTEDCSTREVAAVDSDGGDNVAVAGSCTGGTGASCSASAYLTFAGASGIDGCVGICGTGTNSCVYREFFASDSNDLCPGLDTCTIRNYDTDSSQGTCTGCGLTWGLPGDTGSPCTGDDGNEFIRWRQCSPGSCVSDPTDRAACRSQNSCVMNGVCFTDIDEHAEEKCREEGKEGDNECRKQKKKGARNSADKDKMYKDIDGDGRLEACDPGTWLTPTANSVKGRVVTVGGFGVNGAEVRILGTSYVTLTTTINGINGSYDFGSSVNSSVLYDFVASRSPYSPSVIKDVSVPDFEDVVVPDIVLSYGSDLCEEDCTLTSDETCHASCHGTNGCLFYDVNAAGVCDAVHTGFRVNYNATNEVQCCESSPYVPVKIKATTKINATNVVRITRNVWYEGKLVKMVIDVFS